VRGSTEGKRFARWWRDRLHDFCIDDIPQGLFTDQRWCDHVPVFFPTSVIIRDPGMNLASWNLSQRPVTVSNGDYVIEGNPVRLVHFTKALSVGPAMTLRYAGDNLSVAEMWRWYLEQLESAGKKLGRQPDWSYGWWGEVPVPLAARRKYRNRVDLIEAYPNPFGRGYARWWRDHGVHE